MNFIEATHRYENWIKYRIPIVENDLKYKHEQMRLAPFPFFRATFYRWAQLWPELCPKLDKAPEVLSVGDLHVENFGTWRDEEARLVWGVNDFDEAIPLPYPQDLVRLTTSAFLALETLPHLKLKLEAVAEAIFAGYLASVDKNGLPLVLEEHHPVLRNLAVQELRAPAQFWARFREKIQPIASPDDVPDVVKKSIRKMLPDEAEVSYYVTKKPKGLGSLGRRRYVGLTSWQGGVIAREAKEELPSAVYWARGRRVPKDISWIKHTVKSAIRSADPFYQLRHGWLVRRLSPTCSRIDLEELEHNHDFMKIFQHMGEETANIHLGTPHARKAIRAHVKKLTSDWLLSAATKMQAALTADWEAYRQAEK